MKWTAALLAGTILAVPATADTVVERRLALMGTSLELRVEATDRQAALLASERAVRALEAAEERLSTWRETSELSRLNRAPEGALVTLSPELAAELAAARDCWRATGGAFDPGVGALVDAWGLKTGGRLPSAAELDRARAGASVAELELRDGSALRRHPGLRLEEGGFGKGAGLDRALAALADAGVRSAWLDLGGQVAVWGGSHTLAVAHPADRDRTVLLLDVDSGSVATTGNSERAVQVDGRRVGHVLDPRSGRPAADIGSLTVWAKDALTADCLATGLYVLGADAALAWAAEHPGVEVVVTQARPGGLEARASAGLAGRLRAAGGADVNLRFDGLDAFHQPAKEHVHVPSR